MNKILTITGLNVPATIGIHAFEQKILQPLIIDLTLSLPETSCQDDITNTIDYAKVCELITTHIQSRPFKLIETVAETTITLIEQHFHIKPLSISVAKPHAIANAKNITITMIPKFNGHD